MAYSLHITFINHLMSGVFLQGQWCFWKVFQELVFCCPASGMLPSCNKSASAALLIQTLLTPFALVSTAVAYRHRILLSPEHLLERVFSCGHLSLSYFAGSEVWTGRACFSAESRLQGARGCPSQEGQLEGC